MLQEQAYNTQAMGKVGMVSRENPVPQSHPVFAEGKNVVAGRFGFIGTQSNQVKGTAEAGTTPEGVVIFERLQLNTNGGNSTLVNEGEIVRNLIRGCAFVYNDGAEPNYKDHVLVDPLTGAINCSTATSQVATTGSLNFAGASEVYTDYTSITDGTLSLNINGSTVNLSTLNFSSATSMNDVADVIKTALSTKGTCAYAEGKGLTITSATTGANSTVEFISASEDLLTLLGDGVSINGANAMVDTGWEVLSVDSALQAIEIQRI